MTAATGNRLTKQREADRVADPLAAATRIYGGTMVALDASGNAIPAIPAAPTMRGVANHEADNSTGAAGAVSVECDRGFAFLFANDGSLDRTDIGADVYVVDDQTVGVAGTLIAGKCIDIVDAGVWVFIS